MSDPLTTVESRREVARAACLILEPSRTEILLALTDREMTTAELCSDIGISSVSTRKQLGTLRRGDYVTTRVNMFSIHSHNLTDKGKRLADAVLAVVQA